VQTLATSVRPDDRDVLREGIQEGLAQLPNLAVEFAQASCDGGLIAFERIHTFQEGQQTRKRRIWLLYDGNTLYSLLSQGSSQSAHEHWLSMLNYCHLTFQLGLFDLAELD
jgi:hypothetical protein